MKKSEFVFGVMTYNQESIICETLESIKYQIETYGKDIDCTIIITDDCSKDRTTEIVDRWLDKNEALFCKTEKIFNKENKGVPSNYNAIMRSIKTENFKIIAGDDLISSENIFLLNQKKPLNILLCTLPIYLIGNKVTIDRSLLERQFWLLNKDLNEKRCLKLFKMGMLIHTPSLLYSKSLYIKGKCWTLNSRFRLFEDNPSWYCMLKNVQDIKVKISDDIHVLYRISEKSISNRTVDDALKQEFENELFGLYQIYINEGDWTDKIYFGLKMNPILHKLYLDRIIDKWMYLRYKGYCLLHIVEYKRYARRVYQKIDEQQVFYNGIKRKISAGVNGASN